MTALPVHEDGDYWVASDGKNWLIYKNGVCASTKVATIGQSLGWFRVLQEIKRRQSK
jgi:hypothetical protein